MPQPPRNGGLNDLRPSERMFSDGLLVDSNGNSCIAAVLPFCRLDFVCTGMAASLCFIGMYGV